MGNNSKIGSIFGSNLNNNYIKTATIFFFFSMLLLKIMYDIFYADAYAAAATSYDYYFGANGEDYLLVGITGSITSLVLIKIGYKLNHSKDSLLILLVLGIIVYFLLATFLSEIFIPQDVDSDAAFNLICIYLGLSGFLIGIFAVGIVKHTDKIITDAIDNIDVQINVPESLNVGQEYPIKIILNNLSDVNLSNINLKCNFPKLIKCDKPTAIIYKIYAGSSESTDLFITPKFAKVGDLGKLDISFEINGNTYKKETIAVGILKAIDPKVIPITDPENDVLSISRETEFYQGFIRFKMSVTNTSPFVANDVALEFDFDEESLRIDRHEPDYKFKNGKILIGNIAGNLSKTVAVYFDPMICSKGTDINCLVTYKDAKGQLQTTQMKPKNIKVVCPIMRTDSDINIGRLKELVGQLPYKDSKVYQVQANFDADTLINISREVVQKHDVKHIRTLRTKENKTYELWYYGKTKVNNHDIVIRITISSENQSIELFATTQTPESLVGLLAEVGRELKGEIESKTTGKGNVQQVVNVSIKGSLIQHSDLLSFCDINGNCTEGVVVMDSPIQHSDGSSNVNNCPKCGKKSTKEDKFCSDCGTQIVYHPKAHPNI